MFKIHEFASLRPVLRRFAWHAGARCRQRRP